MAAGRGNGTGAPGADLYAVLGLSRECTDAELKVAYRRLAMIWHPDKCSASGSSARVEEAKERFQEIQEAYSVLSDANKRFLYDVGVYDGDDDGVSGMGDFLGEMADMMSHATPTDTFEELQQLFVDMFHDDLMGICSSGPPAPRPGPGQQRRAQSTQTGAACTSSSVPQQQQQPPPARSTYNPRAPPPSRNGFCSKRGRAGWTPGLGLSGFCFKVTETRQRAAPRAHGVRSGAEGRSCTKQRLATSRDVSGRGFSRAPASWQ